MFTALMSQKTIIPAIIPVAFLLIAILAGCPFSSHYKYNEAWLPEDPAPIIDFNSVYNDMNATAPFFGTYFPLAFSSDRSSKGDNYDIISKTFEISFDRDDASLNAGNLTRFASENSEVFEKIQEALPVINSPANEFGPYLRSFMEMGVDDLVYSYKRFLILFSSDRNGTLDIFMSYDTRPGSDSLSEFIPPLPILASPDCNESYACFDRDYSHLYFCSDAAGDYNICSVPLGEGKSVMDLLSNLPDTASVISVLNSDKDDKCPYICENLMVFCSDREGGYGGFDLYYSMNNGEGWSPPVNLGPKINSTYNEYRPVYEYLDEFRNDLLIFSSDRPGGQGGYDLYYVGVSKLTSKDR